MRLAHRYVLVFLLVLLVSGAVLVVTFTEHRRDVAEKAESPAVEQAEQSAAILDERIRAHRRAVTIAAANPDIAVHRTARQRRALEAFVDRSAFDGASVVDETGEVQWLVTGADGKSPAVTGTDLSDKRYVERALAGERYISEPFVAETGNHVVVISAPIRANGEIVGVLTGSYHLQDTDLFEALHSSDHEATTVEANGETLFTSAGAFDSTATAEAALETVDWRVTAHISQQTAPTDRLAAFQVVSGVTLLGSVIAFGVWVYRSQVRRIGRLLERVRALERREYEAGPTIGGAAEWRRIDEALTRLGATLARREQMLLVLNRILRHNLRNRLNVVIGRADDLESSLEGDERVAAAEIRRTSRDVLELADRARLTEELLEPVDDADAADSAGESDATPRTDVAALVRERVAEFATVADETGSHQPLEDVTVRGPDRAVAACGDEIALAIDELLANVVDHAGPSPTVAITVDVDVETGHVLVVVADDGPGIPADEISVLTGERAISQVTHTAGIGLWLVDWICSRYDGRLVIPRTAAADGRGAGSGTSASEDIAERGATRDGGLRGATVVLELPLAPEENADGSGSGPVPADD